LFSLQVSLITWKAYSTQILITVKVLLLLITWKAYSTQILITVNVLLLLITWKAYSTQILITVNVLLFTGTNFRGFYQNVFIPEYLNLWFQILHVTINGKIVHVFR